MSHEALTWAHRQRAPDPTTQLALLVLADQAEADGRVPELDVEHLAVRARCSVLNARDILEDLRGAGIVEFFPPGARLRLDRSFIKPIDRK